MRLADRVREENRERERQAVAEENAARFAEQVGSHPVSLIACADTFSTTMTDYSCDLIGMNGGNRR